MKKIKLLIFFLILLVFLAKPVYAQPEKVWENIQNFIGEPPELLVNFLKGFGLPEEVLIDWGLIILYIIIPILTFAIVLKAIMVDEVIGRLMGLKTFKGWKGWAFVLLIILFLFPTGLVGMVAMWLYAAAGILVIYGFGALLIVGIITKLAPGVRGRWLAGLVITIFAFIGLSLFNPIFAITIGILGILMTLGSYSKRKYLKIGEPYEEARKRGEDVTMEIYSILDKYWEKIPDAQKGSASSEGKKLIRRAFAGEFSEEEIEKEIKSFEEYVKKLTEPPKPR
jgi:hypothetical protein